MNKLCVLIMVILATGFVLTPLFTQQLRSYEAQAQKITTTAPTTKVKKVTLIADERPVQVASDNALHPNGSMYNAMVFNGTIPGPVIAVDQGDTLQVTLKNSVTIIHSIISKELPVLAKQYLAP